MEETIIDGREAIITRGEGLVVIASKGKGGAVISDENEDVAKEKFSEAMNLAESVYKLIFFEKHGKFP